MATAYPLEYEDTAGIEPPAEAMPEMPESLQRLAEIAAFEGDLSGSLTDEQITEIGAAVKRDYERDLASREDWAKQAQDALDSASQEHGDVSVEFPWQNAADVHYPLLTVSALQFQARAYPAIVKGDEVVQVKVVGKDAGKAQMGPQGPVMGPDGKPAWEREPGSKAARAERVKDYLNTYIFYRMDEWEADTDALLLQLPIVGCAFRKSWWDSQKHKQRTALVPALRLVVPMDATDIKTTPRITEEVVDVYPYQIRQRMRAGFYREFEFSSLSDDTEAPRMLLEQHRLIDLDGDGLEEPYIVTADKETGRLLRVEANFSPEQVKLREDGQAVAEIERAQFYVKYGFIPHPKGKFYDIGFGHLLTEIASIIDASINQMLDAGTAANAGGGFIASGLRLQSHGRGAQMRWRPGEYKTVEASGQALRDGIVERTFPQVSPVTMQLLDMMLAAAKDIAAVKDVLSGDASNNGQVGTTLALIEQGLQVFTAIYKRVYRSLREEYQLIYDNLSRYGGEQAAQDYAIILDDDQANFAADFNESDMDIRPVSDPNSVTRMQKVARAQFLLQVGLNNPTTNQRELMKRVYEAADVEDMDALLVAEMTEPPPPDPKLVAETDKLISETRRNDAQTKQIEFEIGLKEGMAHGEALAGGLPGVAGEPGDPVGAGGGEALQPQPPGGMGEGVMGPGGSGPGLAFGTEDAGGRLPIPE